LKFLLAFSLFFCSSAFAGDPSVMLQGFHWSSAKSGGWWGTLASAAPEIGAAGINIVWFPPSGDSLSPEGYLPKQLYLQDSKYGKESQLKGAIGAMHSAGVTVLGDLVLNHRVGSSDWADFKNPDWGLDACTSDDEYGACAGGADTGKSYDAARDIDHANDSIRESLKEWLGWMKSSVGYDGWRYDYARGFSSSYLAEYDSGSSFSVAEIWDDLDVDNSDAHRQGLCDWMDSAGGKIKVFDFTTKGVLQQAIATGEYWRLADGADKPSGLIGWWPENAVTFIDNHDTAARQGSRGHKSWPFPQNQLPQGYAYILTHPGIPCVFWPHFFDLGLKEEITGLIQVRKKYGIHSGSKVNIITAGAGLYAANIDGKVVVKIGPENWHPYGDWQLVLSGNNYAVWAK